MMPYIIQVDNNTALWYILFYDEVIVPLLLPLLPLLFALVEIVKVSD
jgi:hypothetical protein